MSDRIQPASHFLTVNGLRLHYLDWGNPSAPPLVLLHGFAGSAHTFNAVARHFRDRYYILAPDLRGHGESAWSPMGAYQYTDLVADLEGAVDQLGLERFTLGGASMGGIVAMGYAGAHAERLERLILNDVGPDAEAGRRRITQAMNAGPTDFATLDEAMAFRRERSARLRHMGDEDVREDTLGVLRQKPGGRWGWRLDPEYLRQRAQLGPPPHPALWPILEQLQVPTLVVWGMESDVLSEGQAMRVQQVLPHGTLVAVPGVGHPPTLMEPEALAALGQFLEAYT